jgi:drug/metabolite transporter (DMT)-like permease
LKEEEVKVGFNPNLAAFLGSLCLGINVIFWNISLRRLGPAELFVSFGVAFILTGIVHYWIAGTHRQLTAGSVGIVLLTTVIYVGAIIFMNAAFGHPRVNLPIATAITAAYPVVTAVISMVVLGQRFTGREALFFTMTVVGVMGLGLFSKPH